MLEVNEDPASGTTVSVNASSLEVIQTCKRKAFYFIERSLRPEAVSQGALFGTAIHKALESWYTIHDDDAAIEAFKQAAQPLVSLHEKDKRHPNNGITILKNYFKTYADDPYEIVSDQHGPIVERDFEFTLLKREGLTINVFGRIDCIMRNRDTSEVFVADHKTTSSLGQEFYQRINPNFQYTTYIMAAQNSFGLNTDRFLVNGIQVAKTKWDLARQFTTRDQEDFNELTMAYLSAVMDYLLCRKLNQWPMTAPSPCTMWGGCQYREICAVPQSVREDMITNMFLNPNTAIIEDSE